MYFAVLVGVFCELHLLVKSRFFSPFELEINLSILACEVCPHFQKSNRRIPTEPVHLDFGMANVAILLLLLLQALHCTSFMPFVPLKMSIMKSSISKSRMLVQLNPLLFEEEFESPPQINAQDVQFFKSILQNLTNCLDSTPATAFSIVSHHVDWLFDHDLPK